VGDMGQAESRNRVSMAIMIPLRGRTAVKRRGLYRKSLWELAYAGNGKGR
jgi:hypothetical protein